MTALDVQNVTGMIHADKNVKPVNDTLNLKKGEGYVGPKKAGGQVIWVYHFENGRIPIEFRGILGEEYETIKLDQLPDLSSDSQGLLTPIRPVKKRRKEKRRKKKTVQ